MKAVCTCGGGPPVCLCLDGSEMILIDKPYGLDKWQNGIVRNGNCDLTAEEARRLASELLMAAQMCDELEYLCKVHDDLEK